MHIEILFGYFKYKVFNTLNGEKKSADVLYTVRVLNLFQHAWLVISLLYYFVPQLPFSIIIVYNFLYKCSVFMNVFIVFIYNEWI